MWTTFRRKHTHAQTHTISLSLWCPEITAYSVLVFFCLNNVSYFSAWFIWFENIFPHNCPLHDQRLYIATVHVHLYRTYHTHPKFTWNGHTLSPGHLWHYSLRQKTSESHKDVKTGSHFTRNIQTKYCFRNARLYFPLLFLSYFIMCANTVLRNIKIFKCELTKSSLP